MVTMLILVIGISGSIALIDGANARTLMTKEREAANALNREVIEAARSVPYTKLNPGSAITELQAIPGLADSTPSTTAWTVVRRKQTYTVTMSVCSVDDDQDGFGDKTGGSFCSRQGTGRDRNPDDYKRVTVTVTWTRGGTTRSVRRRASSTTRPARRARRGDHGPGPGHGRDHHAGELREVRRPGRRHRRRDQVRGRRRLVDTLREHRARPSPGTSTAAATTFRTAPTWSA